MSRLGVAPPAAGLEAQPGSAEEANHRRDAADYRKRNQILSHFHLPAERAVAPGLVRGWFSNRRARAGSLLGNVASYHITANFAIAGQVPCQDGDLMDGKSTLVQLMHGVFRLRQRVVHADVL